MILESNPFFLGQIHSGTSDHFQVLVTFRSGGINDLMHPCVAIPLEDSGNHEELGIIIEWEVHFIRRAFSNSQLIEKIGQLQDDVCVVDDCLPLLDQFRDAVVLLLKHLSEDNLVLVPVAKKGTPDFSFNKYSLMIPTIELMILNRKLNLLVIHQHVGPRSQREDGALSMNLDGRSCRPFAHRSLHVKLTERRRTVLPVAPGLGRIGDFR